jgi:hypothetical protein
MNLNVFRKLRAIEPPKETQKKQPLAIEKNSKFVYKRGADVMKLWRSYGFVPPSEYREDYLFKKNREAQSE